MASLSPEAKAILTVASNRGVIEIRATPQEFDSVERFLAVCVEVEENRRLVFRNKSEPRQSIRFLEGFRQLCFHGLAIHHLHREFSLTSQGFELADKLNREDYTDLIDFATEVQF